MKTEILEVLEEQIKKQAEMAKKAELAFNEEEAKLRDLIETYKSQREQLQREAWKESKLCWCQRCEKFHPEEDVVLLYTEGKEWHGSEYTESYDFYRRLRSFCHQCAEILLSRPRGGDNEFQCYKARRRDEGFEIFVWGEWQELSDRQQSYLIIEIERDYIPESEYQFGQPITMMVGT